MDAGVAEQLAAQIGAGKSARVLIQFKATPSRTEREALRARGVRLVSYVGGNAYHAVLTGGTPLGFRNPVVLAQYPALESVRWIGTLEPEDKIEPELREKGAGDWATNTDGTVKIGVHFYRDVERGAAREILARHGAIIDSERPRGVGFYVVIDPALIDDIAAEPAVEAITRYPPPKIESNDGSRAWTRTEDVHAEALESDPAVPVEGGGVILGIWEAIAKVDSAHDDLGARVVLGDAGVVTSEHGTHVACTMAGSGAINHALRGHAPAAEQIVSYQTDPGVAAEMEGAVTAHQIVASNNSWNWPVGWNHDGDAFTDNYGRFGAYVMESYDLDALARDVGLLIVVAAGNDRDDGPTDTEDADQGTGNGGYDTIAPDGSAKNVITAGAVTDTGEMTAFSNWGPTDDGRIKPDLVAPGLWLQSCDDDPDNTYTWYYGTSMAAPAITGVSGLLIQTYRDEFLGDPDSDAVPWPATIKALLINSAQDLGDAGPDYQFGWGGLDAKAAYDLVRARNLLEQDFHETGEEDAFVVDVDTDEPHLKVTLCWDDFPGDGLKNDLDLLLEAPPEAGGGVRQPWTLDPDPGDWADPAGTGVDRANNCEQVHVDTPVAGTWTIRVTAHALNEPVAGPYQRYSLVSNLPFHEEDSVSVVQVIDRTGSMDYPYVAGEPSYMDSAKAAAINFLGLMHLGDEAGAVAFDDPVCDNTDPKAETLSPLTELVDEATREGIISSIRPLEDRGCTSIGAGLQRGESLLTGAAADQPHAMVLLTDGFENRPPWVRERPPGYEDYPAVPNNVLEDIPVSTDVYTIALGPHSDSDLMRDIAGTTGGRFHEAPTILSLLGIYYQIHGDLALAEITGIESGEKAPGNDTRVAKVDAGATEATFVVGWLQGEGRLRLGLTDPNHDPLAADDPNVTTFADANQYLVRVQNPVPGDWEVRLVRQDSGSEPVDYTLATLVQGSPKLWSFVPTTTMVGDCLVPKVRLFERGTGRPITGADVKAIITAPASSKLTLNYRYLIAQRAEAQSGQIVIGQAHAAEAKRVSDPVSTWAANLQAYDARSIAETGSSIFQYETTEVMLLDDGAHEDEAPGDGIYANCADATLIAGGYNIRFEISGVTSAGRDFTRAALATSTLRPGTIDPVDTPVWIEPSVIGASEGSRGSILVVPMDRYGNVWGPGHAARISVDATAGRLGELVDRGDGFYAQTLMTTGAWESGRIRVRIDGVEMQSQPRVRFGWPTWVIVFIVLVVLLAFLMLLIRQIGRP
jgi:hypothetical protein